MKQAFFLFCIVGAFFLSPLNSFAEYRIATVDMNRVLNESDIAVNARKELDKITTSAKKKIESKKENLRKTEERIQSGKIKPDSKEADEFQQQMKEFSRFVKDTEEEIRKEFAKTNRELTKEAVEVVEEYAEKNDIDIVLDKSASPRGPILFGSAKFDITDQVVAKLN